MALFVISCSSKTFDRPKPCPDPGFPLKDYPPKGVVRGASQYVSINEDIAISRATIKAKINLNNAVLKELLYSYIDVPYSEKEEQFLTFFKSSIKDKVESFYVVYQKDICTNNKKYIEAFIILEIDIYKITYMLFNEIREQQEIYEGLRGSEILEELELKSNQYCERFGCG